MSGYIMRAVGFENGMPCPHAGQYLASFDHDGANGRGDATFTRRLSKAMIFDTKAEALIFWRKRSTVRPTRHDGEPNRPLTCLSVSIEPLP